MPISHTQAREIAQRLARRNISSVTERLAPVSSDERPIPPPVPGARDWSSAAAAERIQFLEDRVGPLPHLSGRADPPEPASLQGNIENFIGMVSIPTGLIGPLRINGLHAHGDFYVPMTTSEGTLVASYSRGARLLTQAGGAACATTVEQVQRAPGFVFHTMADAMEFSAWAVRQFDRLRGVAGRRTRHGRLLNMRVQLQANHVYLIFDFHTGEAAGQNMVTICTDAICEELMARTPVAPEYWVIESNMSGDKKATALSFLETRGRNATAEVVVPRQLVESSLRATPERIADYWRMCFVGGVQTGSIGVNGHIANAVTALFLACGQDAACVSEASVGLLRMQVTAEGDLYAAVTLPNLIVGTVGGGTRLPSARECLRILECHGEGSAAKLAEITAAVALAGEISIAGAVCAGEFAAAHSSLGRARLGEGNATPLTVRSQDHVDVGA